MHGDMRTLNVPEPADIIVSELLGSFGDNELSPECLDGAVRFLKREPFFSCVCFLYSAIPRADISRCDPADGISIPASYTAHLAPLASNKLYSGVRNQALKKYKTEEMVFETPYVVMFQQVNLLSGNFDPNTAGAGSKAGPRIQECWSFEHPRRDMVTDESGKSNHGLPSTSTSSNTYTHPQAFP